MPARSAFSIQPASRAFSAAALALAWLGYFSPWLWPVPVALRLSAYDLVEWMTFMQSVRDGTYPVARIDLLWPLAGIAILTALAAHSIQPRKRESTKAQGLSSLPLRLGDFVVKHWPCALATLLALFAAYLILPAYPFILTAHTDPELRPQLILGLAAGVAVIVVAIAASARPAWTRWLTPLVALLSLLAAIRAFAITRQPIADVLTRPAPVGYGFVLAVIGLGGLAVIESLRSYNRRSGTL